MECAYLVIAGCLPNSNFLFFLYLARCAPYREEEKTLANATDNKRPNPPLTVSDLLCRLSLVIPLIPSPRLAPRSQRTTSRTYHGRSVGGREDGGGGKIDQGRKSTVTPCSGAKKCKKTGVEFVLNNGRKRGYYADVSSGRRREIQRLREECESYDRDFGVGPSSADCARMSCPTARKYAYSLHDDDKSERPSSERKGAKAS